jgi:hypothetical protein
MDGRLGFGAPHLVRVRSSAGDVWEAAVQWIYSPELAARVAVLVREFLRRPVPAPAWVHVLREDLRGEGVELGACVVEVVRAADAGGSRWRVVAEFGVRAICSSASGAALSAQGIRGWRSSPDP